MSISVKEFINYRSYCPLCNKKLSLAFKNKNRKLIKYEGNRVLIRKNMYTVKHQRMYSFIYSINMLDNTFYIDFSNNVSEVLDSVPLSYIQDFRKYDKSNTGILYRYCSNCSCYSYNSNYFDINMKLNRLGAFKISTEYLSIRRELNDRELNDRELNDRVYNITNMYDEGFSFIDFFNLTKSNYSRKMDCDHLKIPIQKFDNIKSLTERLDKLIIFS